jgi:hypothetical protein
MRVADRAMRDFPSMATETTTYRRPVWRRWGGLSDGAIARKLDRNDAGDKHPECIIGRAAFGLPMVVSAGLSPLRT